MNVIKIIAIILILALGLYVAVSPDLVYAPTPKIILYLLISFLPALLLGAEAASRFKLKFRNFVFTTAGACAVCLGVLVVLTYLSKPQEKIAVYQIYDENKIPVALDWSGAINIPVSHQGLTVTNFVEGNTVILIFPEQAGKIEMQVKKSPSGKMYTGDVSYSGSRTSKLYLSKDLK